MTRWKNPQTQELLAGLSAHGLSAQKIAAEIGESRNSIKSVLHRYGLYAETRTRRSQSATPQKAK